MPVPESAGPSPEAPAPCRLVLLAHGSRDERWREPFEELAESAGDGLVRVAYLEFAGPTLAEVVDEAAAAGIRRVVVLPLFLATGKHVTSDVRAAVAAAASSQPHVVVEEREPVGQDPRLWALLARIVGEQLAVPAR
jgi:sirohydrochlorin cobaltochelatase